MSVSYPPGRSPADLQRKLAAMAARTQDMTPAMKVGAEAVKRLITKPYNDFVSPGGVPWKPLAPATIAKRRKGSASPLNDSTDLKKSTNTASGARSIFFFATAKYAGFQQFGTRTIPARPFLPITRDGKLVETGQAGIVFDRISKSVGNYIVNGRVR